MATDWLSIGSGAAGSLLSSIGSIWSAAQQKKENEKNRQFQAKQAELSRQYNTQMVNAQNFYNSPSETVKRLLDAGINPALAYNNGSPIGSVGVGSTSQMGSGSGGLSPTPIDSSGLSNIGINSANADVAKSQAGLNEIELAYYPQTKQKEFAIADSVVWMNNTQGNLNDEESRAVAVHSAKLKAETDKIQQEFKNLKIEEGILDDEAIIKNLEALYSSETIPRNSRLVESMIEKYASEVDLNYATIGNMAQMFTLLQLLHTSQANLNDETRKHVGKMIEDLQNKIDNFNPLLKRLYEIDIDKGELILKWQPWLNAAEIFSSVGEVAVQFLGKGFLGRILNLGGKEPKSGRGGSRSSKKRK